MFGSSRLFSVDLIDDSSVGGCKLCSVRKHCSFAFIGSNEPLAGFGEQISIFFPPGITLNVLKFGSYLDREGPILVSLLDNLPKMKEMKPRNRLSYMSFVSCGLWRF